MKIMLKLQFLTCKRYSEQRSTVKNCKFSKLQFFQCTSTHTASSDTIFVQIYMDSPPGVPGVSKNQIFFFSQIKLLSFCANIVPKWHKLQKTIKIEKKKRKENVVF